MLLLLFVIVIICYCYYFDMSLADNQVASTDDFSSDSLFTLVTFASGEDLKPVSIQILDDNIAEITEYFTLQIENPQGGKAIINNAKVQCVHVL